MLFRSDRIADGLCLSTAPTGDLTVVPSLLTHVVDNSTVALRLTLSVREVSPDLSPARHDRRPHLLALIEVQIVEHPVDVHLVGKLLHATVVNVETVEAHPEEVAIHLSNTAGGHDRGEAHRIITEHSSPADVGHLDD